MTTIQESTFALDKASPLLFDSKGGKRDFRYWGKDPRNGENEIYEADLEDGETYWLVTHECDDKTGEAIGAKLERLVSTGGRGLHRQTFGTLGAYSSSDPVLDLVTLEFEEDLPEVVSDYLLDFLVPRGTLLC